MSAHGESSCAVECAPSGEDLSRLTFRIPKAEGIAPDDRGTLYVCGEANHLYVFARDETEPDE